MHLADKELVDVHVWAFRLGTIALKKLSSSSVEKCFSGASTPALFHVIHDVCDNQGSRLTKGWIDVKVQEPKWLWTINDDGDVVCR